MAMTIFPMLLDRIYEAAAIPELWPETLESLADHYDSRSAVLYTVADGGVRPIISPRSQHLVADYHDGNWGAENRVVAERLMAAPDPGFWTHLDWFTQEQLDALPIVRDFWRPRGIEGCCGTYIQGADHDGIIIGFDGLGSQQRARELIPAMNLLRPALARAVTLSGRVQAGKARAAMAGLAEVGTAAAILSADGKVRAATPAFERRLGAEMLDWSARLGFRNRRTDTAFLAALAEVRRPGGAGRTLAVRGDDGRPPYALHIAPIRQQARDLFGDHAALLFVADGVNRSVPNADLIRALFDLTVAEARVARGLAAGSSPTEIAADHKVALGTVRSQLKAVFAKTNVERQSDLVALLAGYGDREGPAQARVVDVGAPRLADLPPVARGNDAAPFPPNHP
jgi:DNA-binding CsgD family transcriptional regulator